MVLIIVKEEILEDDKAKIVNSDYFPHKVLINVHGINHDQGDIFESFLENFPFFYILNGLAKEIGSER